MSVTVLYITGWCRSGSTVLGNVLAEVPGVVHVGELRFLWLNGVLGKGSNGQCGCGLALTDCALWAKVLESVRPAGRTLAEHAADVVSWQDHCRTRHTWNVLQRPPAGGWADTLALTYQAIADQTGAEVIVDSSKFASDAALLTHLPGVRPAYVHLIRDPRAVAWSWLQPKRYTGRRGAANSTWHWTGFNLAAEAVGRARRDASLTLRYEDLTRSPRAAVAAVLELVGRGGAANPVSEQGTVELGGNHTVTGNPNRFQRGVTAITEDLRWPARLGSRDRAVTTAMALPLLRRYGYARRP
ncbi:sulfotransferase [Actinomadura sp. DC4]|uniref:sulfotransferase n=1 Tax=Actinomadura sp. DC4 TaxID=3055069 RepID=UPI0025AFBF37|nr:sulfotransferase [Actinomadura sp. DC4]MDN3356278.1 sulfotransferase [Actinomadura sp. DC4]